MQNTYKSFLEFVGNDVQSERRLVNKKMLSAFLWCFLAPVIFAVIVILLVKMGVLPRRARVSVDWLILVFPVLYSLYILGSEVLVGIPSIFKKGGLTHSLKQSVIAGEWRERVCDDMRAKLSYSEKEWVWVVENFRIDLENLRYRAKYLTALAGAVFFLILQGIDAFGDAPDKIDVFRNPVFAWLETEHDIAQFMALALFLVLLYLSGSQTTYSLQRYLNCAKLVADEKINAVASRE